MSQVLRYVKISCGNVEVKDTFLCFIKFEKKGKALTNLILAKLKDNLDVHDMRGQGYDNAAAAINSGVNCRILDVNTLAIYIHYNNHSLKLAGVHSASKLQFISSPFLVCWIVSLLSSRHQLTDEKYLNSIFLKRLLK